MKARSSILVTGIAMLLLTPLGARAATLEIGPGGDWAATIAAAASGDTIQVHASAPAPDGVYVGKILHFVNYPGDSPVLDALGLASMGLRFQAASDGSSVTGITFQGYTTYALDNSGGSPTVTLSNCVFDNCGWTFGLTVTASNTTVRNATKGSYLIAGSSFTNCTFSNITQQAVYGATGVTISDCTFTNVGYAAISGDGLTLTNVTIDGATTAAFSGVDNVTAANVTISNSNFGFSGSSNLAISNSSFTNVTYGIYNGNNVTLDNVTHDGGSYLAGYSNNVTLSNVTARNLSYVVGGDGATISNLLVEDGASAILSDNVTGSNVTLRNLTGMGLSGSDNATLSDLTLESVKYGAYNCTGLTLTNVVQTETGSYLVGYSNNVTLDNIQADGLGYFVGNGDNVTVTNSVARNMSSYGFTGCSNLATQDVTLDGGGMAFANSTGLNLNRTVIANYQTGAGEAFYQSYGTVTNCTITGNSIVRAYITDGTLDFDSCIVTGNGAFSTASPTASGTASYCLLQTDGTGMTLGDGNLIGYLPRFVDAASGDYALKPTSPAIDAGNPALAVPPEGGSRVDMGAIEYDSAADAAQAPTIAISTPDSSIFSPAFVEGTVSLDTKTVTWNTGGAPSNANLTTAGTFWLNVSLSATAATNLTVTASDGTNNTDAVQALTWTPTDLTGKASSTDSVTIRKDDSLLLTATGTGTLLEIDGDGDGTFEHSGAPGDNFPTLYDTAGVFVAEAKIDGASVGTLTVTVVEVDLKGPVAGEVNFQREKDVLVNPASEAPSVFFASNDAALMSVSVKQLTADGATLFLKPLSRGTPVVVARLGGAAGPIISEQEVDEFTLDVDARDEVIVNDDTDVGNSKVTIRPFIADITFVFTMSGSTSTFVGGATTLSINTSESDPATGVPFFRQVVDDSTGETVGEFHFDIEVPDGENSVCFNLEVRQASSSEKVIARETGINPTICKARVERLILCPFQTGELIMILTKQGPGKHRVKIKKGQTVFGGVSLDIDPSKDPVFTTPDTVPDSDVWGKKFDCTKLLGPQIAKKVKTQFEIGFFHVKIKNTLFKDRIVVTDGTVFIRMRRTNGQILSPPSEYENPPRQRAADLLKTEELGLQEIPVPNTNDIVFENNAEFQANFCIPLAPNVGFRWRQKRTSRLKFWDHPTQQLLPGPASDNIDNFPDDPADDIQDKTPSPSGRIYFADAPDVRVGPNPPLFGVVLARSQFETWVEDMNGNRVSDIFVWHSHITIVKTSQPGTIPAKWVRAGSNKIDPGPSPKLEIDVQDALDALEEVTQQGEGTP